jgi:hypothetical protein
VDREEVVDPLAVGGQAEEVLGDRLVAGAPVPPPGPPLGAPLGVAVASAVPVVSSAGAAQAPVPPIVATAVAPLASLHQDQIFDGQYGFLRPRMLDTGPAQQTAQPQNDLLQRERLRHVVVHPRT